ncbi:hypothetical protein PHYC_02322 [Phycisphaerales bacterium]|nr:hypothetical protein PHYC_02322 [Phycisphaerales bacterium]
MLRWTCTAALAMLLLVYAITNWFAFTAVRAGSGPFVLLAGGALHVHWSPPGASRVVFGFVEGATPIVADCYVWAGSAGSDWTWSGEWRDSTYGAATVRERAVPLWVPSLLLAAVSALLWRSHLRDRRANNCPECNYPLSGLAPGSPCPECGGGEGGKRGACESKP